MGERRNPAEGRYGANMNEWAEALASVDPKKGASIDEPRSVGFANVEKMNLPHMRYRLLPASEFLQNAEAVAAEVRSEQLLISVMPRSSDLPRITRPYIPIAEAGTFVRDNIPEGRESDYDVRVTECYPTSYGGNVVINPTGELYVEFRRGDPGPVGYGTETPEFTATRDRFTGVYKFSFDDPKLRDQIRDMLMNIPHEREGQRDIVFTPGYYEFFLTKRPGDESERPFFLDYRDNPAYYLPSEDSIGLPHERDGD